MLPPDTSRIFLTPATPQRSPHAEHTSYVISFTTSTSGCRSAGSSTAPQSGHASDATRSGRASTSERRRAGGQRLHSIPYRYPRSWPGGVWSRSTPQYWQTAVATGDP